MIYNSRNSKDLIVTQQQISARINLQQQKFKRLNSPDLRQGLGNDIYNSRNSKDLIVFLVVPCICVIYNSRNSKDLIVLCRFSSASLYLQQQKFKRLNSQAGRGNSAKIIYNSRNSKDLIVPRRQTTRNNTYLQQQKFKRLNSPLFIGEEEEPIYNSRNSKDLIVLRSYNADAEQSTTVEIQKT